MRIFVGNLSYSIAEADIRTAFEAFGEVTEVKLMRHRDTGESRGFGFVNMARDQQGLEAIDRLDYTEWAGRRIAVNVAKPRERA
jgi:RNA recognition motif-containing protein